MNDRGFAPTHFFILFVIIFATFGYLNNIRLAIKCDFASPYKAEVLRTVGVFIVPAGIVMGFIPFEDN